MPCNRQELINELRELSEKAQAINEMAAASVLMGLAGSLCACVEQELCGVVAEHSRGLIARIQEMRKLDEWPEVFPEG